jgi:hypothetical protein
MPARSLKVENLLLDLENPRINKAESQRGALQKIVDDQDVKLVALAQSIVEDGLNPMDRLLVIKSNKDSGKFIVVEGNRRLAAIKILNNSAVLTDLDVRSPLKKRFETLAKDFDLKVIEPVDCFEVSERPVSAMWIQQRHTGENDGRGIVNWNGVATARFRGGDPALQALDLVIRQGELSDEERRKVESRFPITTLDRLLSTPDVRAKLGMEINDGKLESSLPPSEILKALRRMVMDLANQDVNVTQLKKKEQQVKYIAGLGKDLPDLRKRAGAPKPIDRLDDSDFKKAKTKPKQKKKQIAVRRSLIPKGCHLLVTNAKVAEIVRELRSLPLESYPHSISVLFRVFLEQSVDHYLEKNKVSLIEKTPGGDKDKKLRKKVEEAVAHLVSAGVSKRTLDGVSKGINDKNNPLYVDTLHNYVHNRFFSPTERDLKVAWDNSQMFFEGIWK